MYKHFFKRVLDFIGALVGLVVLSPVRVVVTRWLHFANKGAGAFFLQERPRRNEKIFKVIKFKTMTDERDSAGNLLPDAQRLTKVGRFVRSTSIDGCPSWSCAQRGYVFYWTSTTVDPISMYKLLDVIQGWWTTRRNISSRFIFENYGA